MAEAVELLARKCTNELVVAVSTAAAGAGVGGGVGASVGVTIGEGVAVVVGLGAAGRTRASFVRLEWAPKAKVASVRLPANIPKMRTPPKVAPARTISGLIARNTWYRGAQWPPRPPQSPVSRSQTALQPSSPHQPLPAPLLGAALPALVPPPDY